MIRKYGRQPTLAEDTAVRLVESKGTAHVSPWQPAAFCFFEPGLHAQAYSTTD